MEEKYLRLQYKAKVQNHNMTLAKEPRRSGALFVIICDSE